MRRVSSRLCLSLVLTVLLLCLATPARGDGIEVVNNTAFPWTLSDLIVYGDNNQSHVFLAGGDEHDDPGEPAAAEQRALCLV